MKLPLPFPASAISLPYGAVDGEFYTFASPHQGTDFSSRSQGVIAGAVIRASGPGRVTRSGVGPVGVTPTINQPNSLAGNSIDVDYGDCITRYMHRPFDSPSPVAGERVTEGDTLGVIGATGLVNAAHLHMETWSKATGRRVNPAVYFDFSRVVTTTTGSAAGAGSIPPTTTRKRKGGDDMAVMYFRRASTGQIGRFADGVKIFGNPADYNAHRNSVREFAKLNPGIPVVIPPDVNKPAGFVSLDDSTWALQVAVHGGTY